MKCLRPRTFRQRFWDSEGPIETLVAVAAALAGAVTTYRYWTAEPPEKMLAMISALGTLLAVLAVIIKIVLKYRREGGQEDTSLLDGVLHTLSSSLTNGVGKKHVDPDLRICIFVPDPADEQSVIQRTNYVNGHGRHGRDRRIPCRCGIVGQALRSGQPVYDALPNGVTVIDHLVDRWGFQRHEAASMRDDRRAWAAIPVCLPGRRVVAVVFLDTKAADFFGNPGAGPRRKLLEAAVEGVADFVRDV